MCYKWKENYVNRTCSLNQTNLVQILILLLTNCVTLNKQVRFSKFQSPFQ